MSKSIHVCQSCSKPKVGRFLKHGVVLYTHHANAGGAWWRPRSNGRHNDFNKNWQIWCQVLSHDLWGRVWTDQGSFWSDQQLNVPSWWKGVMFVSLFCQLASQCIDLVSWLLNMEVKWSHKLSIIQCLGRAVEINSSLLIYEDCIT